MAENPTERLTNAVPNSEEMPVSVVDHDGDDRDVTPEKPPVTPWEIVWNIPDDWLERG